MDKSIWEETIRENADEKGVELRNRSKKGVCAKKGEGVSVVKRRKGGGERIYQRTVAERIYLTVKVTTDSTGILCEKEGWEEANSSRLPIFE